MWMASPLAAIESSCRLFFFEPCVMPKTSPMRDVLISSLRMSGVCMWIDCAILRHSAQKGLVERASPADSLQKEKLRQNDKFLVGHNRYLVDPIGYYSCHVTWRSDLLSLATLCGVDWTTACCVVQIKVDCVCCRLFM